MGKSSRADGGEEKDSVHWSHDSHSEGGAGEAIEVRWSNKTISIIGGILVLIASFTSFSVTHFIDQSTGNQRQDDHLAELDRRVEVLEGIAKANSESRVRVETRLDEFNRQHENVMVELRDIRDLLQKHERETRLKHEKYVPLDGPKPPSTIGSVYATPGTTRIGTPQ